MNLKSIDATNLKDYNGLHIETPLGIVNIYTKLFDEKGRKVNTISIIPDDRFSGERKVILKGNRLIQTKVINK